MYEQSFTQPNDQVRSRLIYNDFKNTLTPALNQTSCQKMYSLFLEPHAHQLYEWVWCISNGEQTSTI